MQTVVSIIIPVYNAEAYLNICLDSILKQSYKCWECILIDDGSSDRSGEICDMYVQKDQRYTVYHTVNCGSSAAREFGLNKAKGEYLYFVDSDDWLAENAVENQYNYMETTKSDFCISPYYIIKNNKTVLCDNKPSSLDKYTYIKELLGRTNLHGGLWCKFIRKNLITKNNIHFPNKNYYEDMNVTITMTMESKSIGYQPIPTYYYRVNDNSLTFSSNASLRFKNFNDFVENLTIVFTHYNLWQYCDIVNSFFGDLNNNKLKLLGLPYSYRSKMMDALCVFPESYRIEPVKGKLYLLKYLALRYKIILPYHIALIVKKYIKYKLLCQRKKN